MDLVLCFLILIIIIQFCVYKLHNNLYHISLIKYKAFSSSISIPLHNGFWVFLLRFKWATFIIINSYEWPWGRQQCSSLLDFKGILKKSIYIVKLTIWVHFAGRDHLICYDNLSDLWRSLILRKQIIFSNIRCVLYVNCQPFTFSFNARPNKENKNESKLRSYELQTTGLWSF